MPANKWRKLMQEFMRGDLTPTRFQELMEELHDERNKECVRLGNEQLDKERDEKNNK